jgi:uncharacterized protein YjbJ (UPF0337 family)
MNWDVIAGDWKQPKGKVTQQRNTLADKNLIDGKGGASAGKTREAYGLAKEEVEKQVKSSASTNNDYRMKVFRMKDSA